MKQILVAGLVFLFLLTAGCATMRLESGIYPNKSMNTTAAGAALGATPGIIAGNGPLAWGGALAGGAIGSLFGGEDDAMAMEESRMYREQIREEWKETYQKLAQASGGSARAIPRIIVVDSENRQPRDWRLSVLTTVEQGLRQRGFEVTVPLDGYSGYRRRVTRNYSAFDADFLAEVLIQDFGTSVKVTVVLRSVAGKNVLDRQGVGEAFYSSAHSRYGISRNGRRERAATLAAQKAAMNIFSYRYEDTLEASQ